MTIGKPHPLSLAKYEIQSDLLYELLTYSDGLPTRLGFSNWNVDHSDASPTFACRVPNRLFSPVSHG